VELFQGASPSVDQPIVRPHRARALGGFVALVAGVLAIGAITIGPTLAAALPTSHATTAAQTQGGNVDAGRNLFLQSCAACHGPLGQGTALGPDITGAGAALADYVLRTGRMPLPDPNAPSQRRPPAFTPDQIADLVAFVASLDNGPPIPEVTTSGADLALGRDLFIANCAACHGASGSGDAVGGGFVAPSLHQADARTVAEAVTVGPGPMPRFSFQQDELNALAAYVEYLQTQPSPGGLPVAEIGPVPEGFIAGFVGLIALIVVVKWVGRAKPSEGFAAAESEALVPNEDDHA
jgi:ubiquinol-cytochrome c reductase cytochrome c subunit